MAKGKKKKKDVDFQKIKLKVGRKLKRDSNETRAEFSSRKIILKEIKSYSDDPLSALARHSDHISHNGKLSLLTHLNAALTPELAKGLNKPSFDSLSKFVLDHSEQVRAAAIKTLKTCYNHLRNQRLPTGDFILAVKPYLDCAYTHVSNDISSDCQRFLEYLINLNDAKLFEPLMSIMLRRYEAGNLSKKDIEIISRLKHYYLRHRQKKSMEEMLTSDRVEPLKWTHSNNFIDFDRFIHDADHEFEQSDREVFLVARAKKEKVVEKYLEIKL